MVHGHHFPVHVTGRTKRRERGLTDNVRRMYKRAMKLADYMALARVDDAGFAKQINRSRETVSRLRRGKMRPDWETMEQIREVTKEAVTANDFMRANQRREHADSQPEAAE